jgi:excisionase family DNA binding protein
MTPPEPRWATVAEAAIYAGMSERTIRRWISQERLTGHRIGPRRIQVDLNDVDALRTEIDPTTTAGQERTA